MIGSADVWINLLPERSSIGSATERVGYRSGRPSIGTDADRINHRSELSLIGAASNWVRHLGVNHRARHLRDAPCSDQYCSRFRGRVWLPNFFSNVMLSNSLHYHPISTHGRSISHPQSRRSVLRKTIPISFSNPEPFSPEGLLGG